MVSLDGFAAQLEPQLDRLRRTERGCLPASMSTGKVYQIQKAEKTGAVSHIGNPDF